MNRWLVAVVVLLTAALAALAIARPLDRSTKSDVEATLEDAVAAWNAGDAQTLAGIYAENARLVDGGGMVWQGRDAITELLLPSLTSQGFHVEMEFVTTEADGFSRVLAAGTGEYSLTNEEGVITEEGVIRSVITLDANTVEIIEQQDSVLIRS